SSRSASGASAASPSSSPSTTWRWCSPSPTASPYSTRDRSSPTARPTRCGATRTSAASTWESGDDHAHPRGGGGLHLLRTLPGALRRLAAGGGGRVRGPPPAGPRGQEHDHAGPPGCDAAPPGAAPLGGG